MLVKQRFNKNTMSLLLNHYHGKKLRLNKNNALLVSFYKKYGNS